MTRNQSQQKPRGKKVRFNDKVEVRYFNQNDPVKQGSTQDRHHLKKIQLLAEIISKLYKKINVFFSFEKKRVCKIRKKQKKFEFEEIEKKNLQTKYIYLNTKKKKLEQDLKQVMEKLRKKKSETFFFYF